MIDEQPIQQIPNLTQKMYISLKYTRIFIEFNFQFKFEKLECCKATTS